MGQALTFSLLLFRVFPTGPHLAFKMRISLEAMVMVFLWKVMESYSCPSSHFRNAEKSIFEASFKGSFAK